VNLRLLGGRDDILIVGARIEPCNVLRDRSIEKFNRLRKIPDGFAKLFRIPLVQRRAVEANGTAGRCHDADQGARQGRLARPAGADHANRLAGCDIDVDTLEHPAFCHRCLVSDVLDREASLRIRQSHGLDDLPCRPVKLQQPFQCLFQSDQILVQRRRGIEGRKRATGQDGDGDDAARRHFIAQGKVRPGAHHHDLHSHSQRAGDIGNDGVDIARRERVTEPVLIVCAPFCACMREQAHGLHHFRVSDQAVERLHGFDLFVICHGQVPGRQPFRRECQDQQYDRAQRHGDAKLDIYDVDDREIDDRPWRIEQVGKVRRRQKAAYGAEIAQGLTADLRVANGKIDRFFNDVGGQAIVEPASDMIEDYRTQTLHHPHERKRDRDDQGQHQQCIV